MRSIDLEVPLGEPEHSIRLLYLDDTSGTTGLRFLQSVRMRKPRANYGGSIQAFNYYRYALPQALDLTKIALANVDFDVVVSPPSSRLDSEPYRAAARTLNEDAIDLSHLITKTPGPSAGESGASYDGFLGTLHVDSDPRLEGRTHLLIVDETFSEGKTAAAVVTVMRRAGLQTKARVTVFAPLRVVKTTTSGGDVLRQPPA